MPDLVLMFGLVGVVVTVAALASGLVDRSPLSLPLLFLAFGFILGDSGFGALHLSANDASIQIVGALTLSLVLFLDAVKLQVSELGKQWVVLFLVIVPGTALVIVLGAVPLALLLHFPWMAAFIGGAVLASTDPIVLREIVRDHRIPRAIRQVLQLEAGMNDIVVLPVLLVLLAVAQGRASGAQDWAVTVTKLLALGPVIGFLIGGGGSWVMSWMDARMRIRQEHQALYGVGLVLVAYSAAAASGGDGFLSAFAAGLGVVLLNQKLCSCFLDYGETTSEMALLLAFVLFGIILSGMTDIVPWGQALLLAFLMILVIRPSVIHLVLWRAKVSWEARAFIAWFGPRGLNSLLLSLLVIEARLDRADLLLATVGTVVTVSVIVHGASATPAAVRYGRIAARQTLEEERESTAAGLFSHEGDGARVTPEALNSLLQQPDPPIILDVRSRSSYEEDGVRIPGSVRVLPDEVSQWGTTHPKDRFVIPYFLTARRDQRPCGAPVDGDGVQGGAPARRPGGVARQIPCGGDGEGGWSGDYLNARSRASTWAGVRRHPEAPQFSSTR